MNQEKAYLSACAIYRDEAPYLREWIEFHRLVGVERFFLYDNRSEDDHLEALAPYLSDGLVRLREWPRDSAQLDAYADCLSSYGESSRWIAFIDLDEFLFSPTLLPVSQILRGLERWPGVGVNWAVFGTSGHARRPEGLVIESYVRRTTDFSWNRAIKSIVAPSRTASVGSNAHFFVYKDGDHAVDGRLRPIAYDSVSPPRFSVLRINHYATRSQEEAERKLARRGVHGKMKDAERARARFRALNEVPDHTILPYAPAVREALARLGD